LGHELTPQDHGWKEKRQKTTNAKNKQKKNTYSSQPHRGKIPAYLRGLAVISVQHGAMRVEESPVSILTYPIGDFSTYRISIFPILFCLLFTEAQMNQIRREIAKLGPT
jgi:hypothetical protein